MTVKPNPTPPDILFFGMHEWYAQRQRSRQLATALAARYRVLYINPIYYSASGFIRDTIRHRRVRKHVWGIEEISSSLIVASFPPLLPKGPLYPAIGRVNYGLLLPFIRKTLRDLDVQNPILWLSTPPDYCLINKLGEQLVVYDCMDRHDLFFERHTRQRIARADQNLLQGVDLVIASSKELFDHCSQYNSNVYVVNNGVDLANFEPRIRPYHDNSLASIPRPIFGFVGYIGAWIDQELLIALAQTYPNASIVMVGPIGINVSALRELPNVYLLGERPYLELGTYMSCFDACLIPFHVNTLTRAVNPIKLYEYLATGKPIVASCLPELEPYLDVVYRADSLSGFLEAAQAALYEVANPSPADYQKRIQVAAENSWEQRAVQIDHLIRSQPNHPLLH